MTNALPSSARPGSRPEASAEHGMARAQSAMRLPVPVPLLFQLYRPIHTMDDVESLTAQLDCARARGCF